MTGQFCLRSEGPLSWGWSPQHLRTVFLCWVTDLVEGMKEVPEWSCWEFYVHHPSSIISLFWFFQCTTSWWLCNSPSQGDCRQSTEKKEKENQEWELVREGRGLRQCGETLQSHSHGICFLSFKAWNKQFNPCSLSPSINCILKKINWFKIYWSELTVNLTNSYKRVFSL